MKFWRKPKHFGAIAFAYRRCARNCIQGASCSSPVSTRYLFISTPALLKRHWRELVREVCQSMRTWRIQESDSQLWCLSELEAHVVRTASLASLGPSTLRNCLRLHACISTLQWGSSGVGKTRPHGGFELMWVKNFFGIEPTPPPAG